MWKKTFHTKNMLDKPWIAAALKKERRKLSGKNDASCTTKDDVYVALCCSSNKATSWINGSEMIVHRVTDGHVIVFAALKPHKIMCRCGRRTKVDPSLSRCVLRVSECRIVVSDKDQAVGMTDSKVVIVLVDFHITSIITNHTAVWYREVEDCWKDVQYIIKAASKRQKLRAEVSIAMEENRLDRLIEGESSSQKMGESSSQKMDESFEGDVQSAVNDDEILVQNHRLVSETDDADVRSKDDPANLGSEALTALQEEPPSHLQTLQRDAAESENLIIENSIEVDSQSTDVLFEKIGDSSCENGLMQLPKMTVLSEDLPESQIEVQSSSAESVVEVQSSSADSVVEVQSSSADRAAEVQSSSADRAAEVQSSSADRAVEVQSSSAETAFETAIVPETPLETLQIDKLQVNSELSDVKMDSASKPIDCKSCEELRSRPVQLPTAPCVESSPCRKRPRESLPRPHPSDKCVKCKSGIAEHNYVTPKGPVCIGCKRMVSAESIVCTHNVNRSKFGLSNGMSFPPLADNNLMLLKRGWTFVSRAVKKEKLKRARLMSKRQGV